MPPHTIPRRLFVQLVGIAGVTLGASSGASARGHTRNFRTHLNGRNQVPRVDTDAQGQAIFQLNKAGDELSYKLIVANIDDVLMAHIHIAPPSENGPVAVWLYPEDGPPPELIDGRFSGVLAEATITDNDVVAPSGLGIDDLDDLVGAIRAGNTYVNVHTDEHPGGEIRGQIH